MLPPVAFPRSNEARQNYIKFYFFFVINLSFDIKALNACIYVYDFNNDLSSDVVSMEPMVSFRILC